MADQPDFIPVAEVVKAVGLKGDIKLYPLINWFEPLLDTDYLQWDNGQPLPMVSWRHNSNCYVVRIEGIDDRNGADAAVGRKIGFLRNRYPEPGFPKPSTGLPFRYLERELVDTHGTVIGIVDEVRLYGAQFTLVVMIDGRQVLIPAIAPILRPDEVLDGPLVIDPPEGLLDVAGD